MIRQQFLILLIIFVNDSLCVVDTLYDIVTEVQSFYSSLNDVHLHSINNFDKTNENLSTALLRLQMFKIGEELKIMEKYMNQTAIISLFKIMKSEVTAVKALDIMQLFIGNVYDDFDKFYDYANNRHLEALVTSVFVNIESNIAIVRKIMTEPKELLPKYKTLIAAITHLAKNNYDKMCHTSQLIPEILVHIFKTVMIAEIKTYVMLGFANKYQYEETRGWEDLNISAALKFQTYFAKYVNILIEHLTIVQETYLKACDPANGTWILNDNCFELEGIARAIIFRYELAECPTRTCSFRDQAAWNKCNAQYYESRDACPNVPTDCTELGSSQTCLSRTSPRRLLFMNTMTLGLIGRDSQCPRDTGFMMTDETNSIFEYLSCACNCYENYSKISLLTVKSRVELNRAITGLRFIRKDHILHIQIKEGLLEAQGYINSSTNQWLPIPDEMDSSLTHSIDKENRNFFLDDIRLPRDSVLTGIHFDKVTRGNVTGFRINLLGVSFDYRSGELNPQNRMHASPLSAVYKKPLWFKPINSIETKISHKPSTQDFQYVQLERSLLIHDFGQSMLPLFDALPVTTDPPKPLNGVGIFHKGADGYAGFISLRVYGINYKKYFDDFKFAYIVADTVTFEQP